MNQTHPVLDLTAPTGVPLTKSNGLSSKGSYPRAMDPSNVASDLNFNSYPMTEVEEPHTVNFIPDGKYANFVVNDAGLQNGGLMNSGPFPSNDLFFGDAVANAVELIIHDSPNLPNYNLDADRGDGWIGWHPQMGSTPSSPPVKAVED